MKIRQLSAFGLAVSLLCAAGPPVHEAAATEVSGRASTIIEWYGTAGEDKATPVYQYLLLNAKDINGQGYDFKSYGRWAKDLHNKEDVKSRLYYAYLEKKDILPSLDLKLGRQFVSTTAGASVLDGAVLKFKDIGPVTLSLFGGGDVAYYEGYDAQKLLFGGEGRLKLPIDLNVGLSYVQKWDDNDLTHELFGLDIDYDHQKMLNLYTEVQFNYLADSITYFVGGAKYHKNSNWTLRGEYLYSLPVFSSTSIYSVFAAEQYKEAMAELTYRLAPGLRSFMRIHKEMYEEFKNAHVIEAGVEKIGTKKFHGYLTAVYRDDEDGQDLTGFKIYGATMMMEKLQCGIGANVDVMERRIEEDFDETTNQRYWIDGTYTMTRKISFQAKAEGVRSDLWNDYYRGQARFNLRF